MVHVYIYFAQMIADSMCNGDNIHVYVAGIEFWLVYINTHMKAPSAQKLQ